MEAPEKLYLSKNIYSTYLYQVPDPDDDTTEEYTRTDTFEVKEVDLELITGWFDHIAQIADDRMTLTNQRMTDSHALDEIKCLAKNSSEFIKMHYKAQKGE